MARGRQGNLYMVLGRFTGRLTTGLCPTENRPDGSPVCKGMTLTRGATAGLYTMTFVDGGVPFFGHEAITFISASSVAYTSVKTARSNANGTLAFTVAVAGTPTDVAVADTIEILAHVFNSMVP